MIQLPSSIWKKLSPEKKQQVYDIRKLQNKMDRAYFDNSTKKYERLKKEIVALLAEVMIDIEKIQKKLHIRL
jgi:vacuolar-type H+-ATPase subunit C/Vma6